MSVHQCLQLVLQGREGGNQHLLVLQGREGGNQHLNKVFIISKQGISVPLNLSRKVNIIYTRVEREREAKKRGKREREREGEGKGEREREKETESKPLYLQFHSLWDNSLPQMDKKGNREEPSL